jgi:hypothetical protein
LFFRENWPDNHDLDRKKPRLRFFEKIHPTTMINAENNEILFFRQIWADGHELPEKNTNYVFFY